MHDPPLPAVTASEIPYSGNVVRVRRDSISGASGRVRSRDVVEHPDCVCGVARMPDGRIILVRQYRHPAAAYLWELPAGKIDPGETPREAFARELVEECGVGFRTLEEVCAFYTSPGVLTERMHLFVADGCHEGAGAVNPGEISTWKAVTVDDALSMIALGEIIDGKTLVGILHAARR